MSTPLRLGDSIQRFKRVLQIGNSVTIKLAQRDMLNTVTRMSPMELVNALKLTSANTAKLADAKSSVNPIINECMARKFKGFNGRDFAVFLASVQAVSTHVDKTVIATVVDKLVTSENLRNTRTTDICISLLSLCKVGDKPTAFLPVFMGELVNGERIKQMNEINVCQVLRGLSAQTEGLGLTCNSNQDICSKFFQQLLKVMTKNMSGYSNESLAFTSFATVNCLQAVRYPRDCEIRKRFFESIIAQVASRDTLTAQQLVTCIRVLGRERVLEKSLAENCIKRIDISTLSEHQKQGLDTALHSVGLANS